MEPWVRSPGDVSEGFSGWLFQHSKEKEIKAQTLSEHLSGYWDKGHCVLLAHMGLVITHKLLVPPSSFFPSLMARHLSFPNCRKSGGQKHYWRSSGPDHSQAFWWPNWDEAYCLSLAWGLMEGKVLVFLYGTAKHLCVRWLVVNRLLIPGSWLEIEAPPLEFSKDIKKPVEAVPFTESQGHILHGCDHSCWLRPFLLAAAASLTPHCSLLHRFWTLGLVITSCYWCGVDKCIWYLQLLCSSQTPLHHHNVNQRCLHGQQYHTVVSVDTCKPRADFASSLRGSQIWIQHPHFRHNLLYKRFVMGHEEAVGCLLVPEAVWVITQPAAQEEKQTPWQMLQTRNSLLTTTKITAPRVNI